MNSLSHNTPSSAVQSEQIAVSLLLTETTALTEEENSAAPALKLEAEMNRRANAMTATLTGIIDRPAAMRHWGLNE